MAGNGSGQRFGSCGRIGETPGSGRPNGTKRSNTSRGGRQRWEEVWNDHPKRAKRGMCPDR
eukprot:13236744-Alexandrium_andersonii.AAC.1